MGSDVFDKTEDNLAVSLGKGIESHGYGVSGHDRKEDDCLTQVLSGVRVKSILQPATHIQPFLHGGNNGGNT